MEVCIDQVTSTFPAPLTLCIYASLGCLATIQDNDLEEDFVLLRNESSEEYPIGRHASAYTTQNRLRSAISATEEGLSPIRHQILKDIRVSKLQDAMKSEGRCNRK